MVVAAGGLLLGHVSAGEAPDFIGTATEAEFRAFAVDLPPHQLNVAVIDASPLPPWGVIVSEVTPGSPAEKAGLAPGSVIHTFNGRPYWHHRLGLQAPSREIEAVSPEGATQRFEFGEGRLGIRTTNHHHPGKYLLGELPRGAWDRDMLIAMLAWERGRYAIADHALARAREKGMPENPFSTYYGAMLAMGRSDHAAARRLFDRLKDDLKKHERPPRFFLSGLATLAFEYHDFALLRRVIEEDAGLPEKIRPEAADIWSAVKTGPDKPLLPFARANAGPDVISEVRVLRDGWAKDAVIQSPEPLRGGRYLKFGEPNKHFRLYFGPKAPLRNVLWEMRLVFGHAEPPSPLAANSVEFGLMDRGIPRDLSSPEATGQTGLRAIAKVIALERHTGERWTGFGGGSARGTLFTQRALPFLNEAGVRELRQRERSGETAPIPPGARAIHLALVRIGNEVEISADGEILLRLPIDPEVGDLGCFIRIVGMAVAIEDMTLRPVHTD